MGRMLPVESYGEMNSLFSIMMWFSMIIAPITLYFARASAKLYANKEDNKLYGLFIHAYSKFGLAIFFCLITASLLTPFISRYMHIGNFNVLLVFIAIAAAMGGMINNGFIQGYHYFQIFSFLIIIGAVFKYVFCLLFVYFNHSTRGILYGLTGTGLALSFISFYYLIIKFKKKHQNNKFVPDYSDIKYYLIPMIIANFIFGAIHQTDMILVKHFFSPHDAGIYSSAAIMGKAVMYLPGAIVLSLFPMVSAEKARKGNTLHLLFKALGVNFLLSGSGVLLLNLFPDFIIGNLFGARYMQASDIVGFFSLAMFPIGIITIIINYFLALGKVKFTYSLAVSLFIQIAGIYLYHDTLKNVLSVILISGTFSVVIFGIIIAMEYRDNLRSGLENA